MLVHNWREVLKRAWSVRLMVLALLFIIIEPIYTFVAATWVSRNIYIQLGMSAITGLHPGTDTIVAPRQGWHRSRRTFR
ncbi:hypothetical protein [Rhizobium leguminosarum]|uniref:DUF7940 domain-containing protein n=1 Tax=Rhizobium leguminosarum TaxID=384 RepID=UPI001C9199A7|nr:hypothetical protein [Rhizobium leguminosarum]MBY3004074.1 hypothetical protein [Rhizobium leguminosarum]